MFGCERSFKRHQLIHTGQKPYECNVCDGKFTRMDSLQRHMLIHTKRIYMKTHEIKMTHTPANNVSVTNELADSVYKSDKLIKYLKQKPVKPMKCLNCDRSFTRRFHLLRHRLIHCGTRPSTCEICSKTFNRKDSMHKHMVKCINVNFGISVNEPICHNGKTEYKSLENRINEKLLDIQNGKWSKDRTEHFRRTHAGAYSCDMCSERFVIYFDLCEHKRIIHMGSYVMSEILVGHQERFRCPVCQQFYSIVELSDHLKCHVVNVLPVANDPNEGICEQSDVKVEIEYDYSTEGILYYNNEQKPYL